MTINNEFVKLKTPRATATIKRCKCSGAFTFSVINQHLSIVDNDFRTACCTTNPQQIE